MCACDDNVFVFVLYVLRVILLLFIKCDCKIVIYFKKRKATGSANNKPFVYLLLWLL